MSPEGIIDTELSLVDAGLQTKAMALKRIRDMTHIEQAEAVVAEAEKERQKAREAEMSLLKESVGGEPDKEGTPKPDTPPESQGGEAKTETEITS